MTKDIADRELSLIEQCVSGHPEGIGVSGLEVELSRHGLAMQRRTLLRRLAVLHDMAKNFFSGVVILLDKPFSIGDWITVGDVEGEVVDINFRSTKVRAVDNSIYILTNSTVSSATINNATLRNKRLYRNRDEI
jgi:hypothetical protein